MLSNHQVTITKNNHHNYRKIGITNIYQIIKYSSPKSEDLVSNDIYFKYLKKYNCLI